MNFRRKHHILGSGRPDSRQNSAKNISIPEIPLKSRSKTSQHDVNDGVFAKIRDVNDGVFNGPMLLKESMMRMTEFHDVIEGVSCCE